MSRPRRRLILRTLICLLLAAVAAPPTRTAAQPPAAPGSAAAADPTADPPAEPPAEPKNDKPAPATDPAPAADTENPLLALAPLVGAWDELVRLQDGRHFTAHGTCSFILGKAFLQAEFTIRMSDESSMQRMTLYGWDRTTREQRAWVFASSGVVREATWQFDTESKTLRMQFKPTEAGVTTTSKSRFVSDDRIEWAVESRDQNDKVVFSLEGVDTRRP